MNKNLRLLLAHSFNRATLSDVDLSDVDVAQWFKDRIEEYSGGKIEVVSLDNAAGVDSIPDEIRAAIRDCDGVFCLFTRRYYDSFCNRWLAPEYVISESGYAQALYQSLTPWKRVVGFAEDGVDRNHLGIAFSGGQNVPTFIRNNLDGCREALKSQVRSILANFGQVRAQPPMVEAQKLHKNVIVRRDGFVVVHSRCKDCPPELPPPIFYPNGKEEGGQWQTEGMMQQDVNDFDTYYEAYSETVTDLEGQILVCWKPAEDYHRYRKRTSQPMVRESRGNPR